MVLLGFLTAMAAGAAPAHEPRPVAQASFLPVSATVVRPAKISRTASVQGTPFTLVQRDATATVTVEGGAVAMPDDEIVIITPDGSGDLVITLTY